MARRKLAQPTTNPNSYNTSIARTRPISNQRTYSGKDLMVTSFTGSSTFESTCYSLNPRLPNRFASASLTASRYDTYEFEELIFRYQPTTAVTTTPGVVFMAWEPNANRAAPESVAAINAYEHHAEGPIYSPSLELRIPKSKLQGLRFTRAGPTSSDLNLYDTGKFIVASDAVTNSEGGYFEVSYRLRFSNYHLEDTIPTQHRCGELVMSADQPLLANQTLTVAFDTITEEFGCDQESMTTTAGTITLPAGKFLFNCIVSNVSGTSNSQFWIEMVKNGQPLVPPQIVYEQHTAGDYVTIPTMAVITSNGSDTFAVRMRNGGGTSTMLAQGSVITVLAL